MKDLNAPRRNQKGIIWFSPEKWDKIRNQYLRMRVGGLVKEISRRQEPADPEPKTKYDQVFLGELNPSRPDPQSIHECKVDKEGVPNKYREEVVFEPEVKIQHSLEMIKKVIYFERILVAVRMDTTGGCQNVEVKSLVKENKQTAEVTREKMEY